MVFASVAAENVIVFVGEWGGAVAGHSSICRVFIHWDVFGCDGKDNMEILVLFFDAVDVLMHGSIFGEDNEESSFCRGEEL